MRSIRCFTSDFAWAVISGSRLADSHQGDKAISPGLLPHQAHVGDTQTPATSRRSSSQSPTPETRPGFQDARLPNRGRAYRGRIRSSRLALELDVLPLVL